MQHTPARVQVLTAVSRLQSLGSDNMLPGRQGPTFQRNLRPPSSGEKYPEDGCKRFHVKAQ